MKITLCLPFIFTLLLFSSLSAQEQCSQLDTENRAVLRERLKLCEIEIEKSETELRNKQVAISSTERDLLFLTTELKKRQLQIRKTDLKVYTFNKVILEKTGEINKINEELKAIKELLKFLYQNINEVEKRGLISILFQDKTLSSIYSSGEKYNELSSNLFENLDIADILILEHRATIFDINESKTEVEGIRVQQQEAINEKRNLEDKSRAILTTQRHIEDLIKDDINEKETVITKIRNKLFEFAGGGQLRFGQAYELSKFVEKTTGISPVFLLGLLKHESNLGKNVGTANYLKDMHPTRDRNIFLAIVKALDIDPNEIKVSAALRNRNGKRFGWGGAMGPAQFIPSTWVCYAGFINIKYNSCSRKTNVVRGTAVLKVGSKSQDVRRLQQFLNENRFLSGNITGTYTHATAVAVTNFQEKYSDRILSPYNLKRGTGQLGPSTRNAVNELEFSKGPWTYRKEDDRIRAITKDSTISNPWNARDAFVASGLLLKELGGAGGATSQCTAARKYYAGGNWRSAAALNYCRNVLAQGRLLQKDINVLK